MAVTEKCENCRFWWGEPHEGEAQCRRHAPQAVNFYSVAEELMSHLTLLSWHLAATDEEKEANFKPWEDVASNTFAVWITTDMNDWCGDYEPKPEAPPC